MEKAETAGGLLLLTVGAILLFEAYKLPYMVEDVPGPGFLPLWLAIGILLAGLSVTVSAVRGRLRPGEPIVWPATWGWRQVITMMAALALALLFLDTAGFLVTTTLFMAVVIYSLGVRSWLMLISAPLAAAGILYSIFALWLRVPLPQGILNI
jgi:putative tricarboxylic transport membrane protein